MFHVRVESLFMAGLCSIDATCNAGPVVGGDSGAGRHGHAFIRLGGDPGPGFLEIVGIEP